MTLDNKFLKQEAFIGGEWISAASGATIKVSNPANSEIVGTVPYLSATEVDQAITAASVAQATWKTKTAKERSTILHRWADIIVESVDDLASLLTAEQGKPLAEARGEVMIASSYIRWFAEECRRAYGDVIPTDRPNGRMMVLKEPVGVVAAITPWNFPIAMIARKVGAAASCGCTCVVKPASETPFSALALAFTAEKAGVPSGVVNIVTGDAKTIGATMMSSESVRKVSFTGSTEVGKLLMHQAADTMKRISLELGGNAPVIVFDDADLDNAISGTIASKFRNAGQTCVCANRIYVQSGIHDRYIAALTKAMAEMKIGPGTEPGVSIGPLISINAIDKVEQQIADAIAKGGKLVIGGNRLDGLFMEPTLIDNCTSDMRFVTEETFGPLAPVISFDSEAEAYAMANNSDYGLASYVFTRDIGRAWRAAEALETGLVGINEGVITSEAAPFGGYKQSGIGREGSFYGLDEYLEVKYVFMGGIND